MSDVTYQSEMQAATVACEQNKIVVWDDFLDAPELFESFEDAYEWWLCRTDDGSLVFIPEIVFFEGGYTLLKRFVIVRARITPNVLPDFHDGHYVTPAAYRSLDNYDILAVAVRKYPNSNNFKMINVTETTDTSDARWFLVRPSMW